MPRKAPNPPTPSTPKPSDRDQAFVAMDRLLLRIQKQFTPFLTQQGLVDDIRQLRLLTAPIADTISNGVIEDGLRSDSTLH